MERHLPIDILLVPVCLCFLQSASLPSCLWGSTTTLLPPLKPPLPKMTNKLSNLIMSFQLWDTFIHKAIIVFQDQIKHFNLSNCWNGSSYFTENFFYDKKLKKAAFEFIIFINYIGSWVISKIPIRSTLNIYRWLF